MSNDFLLPKPLFYICRTLSRQSMDFFLEENSPNTETYEFFSPVSSQLSNRWKSLEWTPFNRPSVMCPLLTGPGRMGFNYMKLRLLSWDYIINKRKKKVLFYDKMTGVLHAGIQSRWMYFLKTLTVKESVLENAWNLLRIIRRIHQSIWLQNNISAITVARFFKHEKVWDNLLTDRIPRERFVVRSKVNICCWKRRYALI